MIKILQNLRVSRFPLLSASSQDPAVLPHLLPVPLRLLLRLAGRLLPDAGYEHTQVAARRIADREQSRSGLPAPAPGRQRGEHPHLVQDARPEELRDLDQGARPLP